MEEEVEICPYCEIGIFKKVKDIFTDRMIIKCTYCGFIKKVCY